MAKVNGPLLSFGAKGQIGNAAVFANWRGIDYARQYVKPANPRTAAQQANRALFAFLREMYKRAPAVVRAPWDAFALGRPFTGVNKYVGENVRILGPEASMLNMIHSPGAAGGLPLVGMAAAAGAAPGEVDVTVQVNDELPADWTLTGVAATAVVEQDPHGIFFGAYPAQQIADPAATITLSGFEPGQDIVAYAWAIYEKPNGTKAYSASISQLTVAA